MKRWLSFFKHTQPNSSIAEIWPGLFLNLGASVIPFIFVAPLAATLTCVFLTLASLALHLLKWRLYGPLTYVFSIFIIASLRSTLPHGSFSGDFFATAFAVLALMKTFNLRTYGDGIILLILTLGVNASLFLLDDDISFLVIFWTFATTLWTLGNLLRINLKNFSSPALLASLKSAAYAIVYTLPLLIFLFYIFQRFSHTPYYNDQNESMIGLSRSLEPGKISKLTSTNNIALRVKLSQNEFPLTQLYWKGSALTKSMGIRWGAAKDIKRIETPPHMPVEQSERSDNCLIHQTVYAQRANLLGVQFALDEPIPDTKTGTSPYVISSELCTQKKNLEKVSKDDLKQYLRVQTSVSPEVRHLVRELRKNATGDERYLANIFHYFKKEKFEYSLTPTVSDSLDVFLFKTKTGFCEHYAAAFATLARLGGVPSRVITGFQGGTYNSFGNYWIVSYKDAHAWTEVWLKDRGWVRFDPTAIVALNRIQKGADALPGAHQGLTERLHLAQADMLIDAFFFWVRGLFDNRETLISLNDLTFNPFHLGALGFVFLCWLIIRQMRKNYSLGVFKQFKKLSQLLNERTIPRGRAEGFDDYRKRLLIWLDTQRHFRPLAAPVDRVFTKYIDLKYSAKKDRPDEIRKFYNELKFLQRAILLKTNFLLALFKKST